jgi:conjugal transfer ATP-binding protein TraC
VVDPYKRLLFSTRPDEVAAIRALRAQGMELEEAIERLLSSGPKAA